MYLLYSFLLSLGFLLMSPLFLLRREKYASGFKQRLGNYPKFDHDRRKVIWLHCVSVGETNAARPLVDQLLEAFPDHRLVISTTTRTGQELAQKIFADRAAATIYFPFDWKFSVRRALENYKPSLILLMETEIWPRFIREGKQSGANVAIVNGRLSEKSFQKYSKIRSFMKTVLTNIDLGLIQSETDADRFISLGIDPNSVRVTGNLKFDHSKTDDSAITDTIRERFQLGSGTRLLVAASTHETEEAFVLEAIEGYKQTSEPWRLLIAPRHPERFDAVAVLLQKSPYSLVRRTDTPSERDRTSDVILLDSIGELRAVYPLADLVFVGGSVVPHGGQSVIEPAAFGRAIVTGPFTHNFTAVINDLKSGEAIMALDSVEATKSALRTLILIDDPARKALGDNALETITKNRGATERTVAFLKQLLDPKTGS